MGLPADPKGGRKPLGGMGECARTSCAGVVRGVARGVVRGAARSCAGVARGVARVIATLPELSPRRADGCVRSFLECGFRPIAGSSLA